MASVLPERHLGMIFGLFKSNYGLVVELDSNGKIIGSYHDPDGVVIPDVSQVKWLLTLSIYVLFQVSDDKHYLYLGSFHSNFIAQVPKKK